MEISSDGGDRFTAITTGLDGGLRSYEWSVPADIARGRKYRIRVVARDAAGNTGQDTSDSNFKIK